MEVEVPQKPKTQVIEEAVAALRRKGVHGACPRCSKGNWNADIVAVYVSADVPPAGFAMPPPHLPVVMLICTNCGFTSMHNLRALGVLT